MWIGVRHPLVMRMTIGRPQRQPLAVHFMVCLLRFRLRECLTRAVAAWSNKTALGSQSMLHAPLVVELSG